MRFQNVLVSTLGKPHMKKNMTINNKKDGPQKWAGLNISSLPKIEKQKKRGGSLFLKFLNSF